MVLPLYLAQTTLEMAGNPLPERLAYMACHFSPGGQGLSNLPERLPPGAMLILDDSTPMDGHDAALIARQLADILQEQSCEALLLDFQRQNIPEQQELVKLLVSSLPCPVGAPECYARDLPCPIFLPPLPPDKALKDHLAPCQGREIWLEAALDGLTLSLTESGCTASALPDFPEEGRKDERLHCHYVIQAPATFHLWRTREDLTGLLKEAEALGVSKAVGLWQELGP